jgi:branched-chain amino acid transport system ATP-binding protein
MLSIEDLHVAYGRTEAVRGVSLEVGAGETVGMVGPNGAGKSTTLRAVVGLVPRATGRITFAGEPILGRPADEIARAGLGLVPEGHRIFGGMSVRDNLALSLTARKTTPEDEAALESVLERFPVLRRTYTTTAGKLSGGEQQQLAIARALVARPRVLLLDEPSLGLAPRFVDLVFEILAELRAEGVTMLLVEQSVTRTIEFCDRTYIMRAGRIELSGTAEQLRGAEKLATAYLGG